LQKLAEDYDPTDRIKALTRVQEAQETGNVLTGLLYVKSDESDLHDILETPSKPLNEMSESELCPGSQRLEQINQSFR